MLADLLECARHGHCSVMTAIVIIGVVEHSASIKVIITQCNSGVMNAIKLSANNTYPAGGDTRSGRRGRRR